MNFRKKRLALGYAFVAWNAIGYISYLYMKGTGDKAKQYGIITKEEEMTPSSVQYARLLNIEKATIKRYKGFTKVDEFEYDAAKDPHRNKEN